MNRRHSCGLYQGRLSIATKPFDVVGRHTRILHSKYSVIFFSFTVKCYQKCEIKNEMFTDLIDANISAASFNIARSLTKIEVDLQ